MEDMWKDIPTLSFHSPLTPNPTTHLTPILFDFFTSSGDPNPPAPAPANPSFNRRVDFPSTSHSMASSSTAYLMDSFLKKSCSGEKPDFSGDRKFTRMMKNRESAVRSRARRNAYRFELEKEKNLLVQENARLRRNLRGHQLFLSAAGIANGGKEEHKQGNHLRSLSALF